MSYTINNLNIEIKFNVNDIVIQIEDNDKLFQDVFTLDEIKQQNGYFNSMKKVETFINNCLTNKPGFIFNFTRNKTFLVKLNYKNDMAIELDLIFKLLPIRKDISNNQEIISLKKQVKFLQTKIKRYNYFDNFYFHDNLCEPVRYSGYDNLCFSNLDEKNPILLGHYRSKMGNNKICTDFLNFTINDVNTSDPHSYLKNGRYNQKYINYYQDINRNMIFNCITNYRVIDPSINFITEDFQFIKCKKLFFCNVENICLKHIPKVDELIIINTDYTNLDDITDSNCPKVLTLFNCTGMKIDALKNITQNITINLYTKNVKYNPALFGSNIKINRID